MHTAGAQKLLPNPPSFFQESGEKQRRAPGLRRAKPVVVMCLRRELRECTEQRLSVRLALASAAASTSPGGQAHSDRDASPAGRRAPAPGSRPAGVPASRKQDGARRGCRRGARDAGPLTLRLGGCVLPPEPLSQPQLSFILSAWMELSFSGQFKTWRCMCGAIFLPASPHSIFWERLIN